MFCIYLQFLILVSFTWVFSFPPKRGTWECWQGTLESFDKTGNHGWNFGLAWVIRVAPVDTLNFSAIGRLFCPKSRVLKTRYDSSSHLFLRQVVKCFFGLGLHTQSIKIHDSSTWYMLFLDISPVSNIVLATNEAHSWHTQAHKTCLFVNPTCSWEILWQSPPKTGDSCS